MRPLRLSDGSRSHGRAAACAGVDLCAVPVSDGVCTMVEAEAVRWCSMPVAIAEAVCSRSCAPMVAARMVEPQPVPSVAAEARCLSPDGTLCRCGSVRLSVCVSDGVCTMVEAEAVCSRSCVRWWVCPHSIEPQRVPVWICSRSCAPMVAARTW